MKSQYIKKYTDLILNGKFKLGNEWTPPTTNKGYSPMEILNIIENKNKVKELEVKEIILGQWLNTLWDNFQHIIPLIKVSEFEEKWEEYIRQFIYTGKRFY